MDRATVRFSFISVILAVVFVAVLGMVAVWGFGASADTALADAHTHDGSTAWTATDSLPPTAGNYYLIADVTLSSTWTVPTGTTNLCLNGHGIRMTGNNSVVTINAGATLKLYDCDTTTEHRYSLSNAKSNGAGFATVNDSLTSGYLTFKGGYVTGGRGRPINSWNRGGALYIEGAVEMYGGTLIGNGQYGTTHGGAFNTQGTGSFKMYGGSIQNNAAQCGGATRLQGSGSCGIYGGKIINNIVTNDGGAIHVGGEISVILQDCEISGNYAGNGPGAGIWMTTTGMVISGRTIITDNLTNSGESNVEIGNGYVIGVGELTDGATIGIKPQSGTGIFTSGWADVMGSADPADYFVSDNAAYEAYLKNGEVCIGTPPHKHDGIIFEAWTSSGLPNTTGNWYLAADVSISDTWVVPTGTVNLCLCGHGIRMTGNNSVVTINAGATLKLYDCDTTTEHRYSLSNAKSNGAGFATVNDSLTSGYLTFKGGYVTGGRGRPINSWNRGGALYIEGAVEMYGGTLIGNGQYGTTHGGAFNTQGTGSFKMYGGSIQNNAAQCGGATRLQGSGSCGIYGGKIINNIVTNDGGAIHVGGEISVILQDCEISGNYAGNGPGAGIWMTTTGMVISGRTIITDNLTNSGESNVEIGNGYVIGVGELTDGATIGIKPQSGTGIFTSGWATSMEDADPSDYFTSDAGYYVVSQNGEAVITDTLPHIHSWNYTADGNVITATCVGEGDCNLSEQTLTITAIGKTYDGTAVVATLSFSDDWTVANGFEVPEIEDIEYSGNTTAGTYTASITVGEKTAVAEFTIAKVVLTITAEAKEKVYGENDPSFTYIQSGLVGSDTITGELSRESGENIGEYAITQGTLSAGDNYDISYVGANLVINKKTLTITAEAKEKIYGDEDPSFTYIQSGLVGSDTITGKLSRESGENIGTYAITQGTLTAGNNYNISYVGANLVIKQKVETFEPESSDVKIDGLDEEIQEIISENPDANSISLVMTVEAKTEETAVKAASIIETAKNKSLEFFEVKIEKTIDGITTVLDTTSNVLEIAVPYEKVNKRGLIVYSYHDGVRTFVESDAKEDGTFRVDKENKLIYVYANKFSTYAIGYTPYYRVQTSLSLGSYEGKASVTIKNDADENISFTLESADAKNIVFPDVPKGQYTMTIIWEDGKTNTLTMTLTVGPKAVLSAITEQDAESETSEEQVEEQETQVYSPYIETTDESEILTEDAKIETVAAADSYVAYKEQAINREVGLVPRKRE